MDNIKVRLSMEVPGASMLSSSDCEKMSPKEAYNHTALPVEVTKKKGKKVFIEKEVFHIYTRKCKPARQSLSISKEAYDYMISTPPSAKYNKKIKIKTPKGEKYVTLWDNMSYKDKLKSHFDLIAESLGAYSYTFELLED